MYPEINETCCIKMGTSATNIFMISHRESIVIKNHCQLVQINNKFKSYSFSYNFLCEWIDLQRKCLTNVDVYGINLFVLRSRRKDYKMFCN